MERCNRTMMTKKEQRKKIITPLCISQEENLKTDHQMSLISNFMSPIYRNRSYAEGKGNAK